MKKYFKYAIIGLGAAMAIWIGVRMMGHNSAPVITVRTTHMKVDTIITSVTATGTVKPVNQVEVGTQVSGLVKKIYVDYNSTVKKGQLLAELDKTNLSESVNNAQAAYNAAVNDATFYEQNYQRQLNMYNAGVISKADYEQATYQINNARATVAQRKTTLAQARVSLGYTSIYSPIDGIIISREVQEGQTVAAAMSTPTLFKIAKDITQMQVEAAVDEADIGEVREGQRVSFTVDAFQGKTFAGEVRQVRLGATTTSNVVTYTVIIDADNPDHMLKPGLTATVTIYTKEINGVNTVETQALNFAPDAALVAKYYKQINSQAGVPQAMPARGGSKQVWVLNADGTIAAKTVTTGTNDGVRTEVTSGLTAADAVVTRMEEESAGPGKEGAQGNSPFMPKFPGKQNKKGSPAK